MPISVDTVPGLRDEGVLIDVEIRPAAPQRRGTAPVKTAAMIDTGTNMTIVVPKIAEALGLHSRRKTRMGVVGGTTHMVPTVDVMFGISRHRASLRLRAAVIPLPFDYECLIGRDVLEHAALLYFGRANVVSFSIPTL